ncbi:MAG: dihydropteroate synthase [Desulfohalobiaceae bacterium]|nr:dihydropteroate synthase [Desulfohalobiaceae bacterium]
MSVKQTWTVAGGKVLDLNPYCIVGIVNVTPDSFYDGGLFFRQDEAVEQTLRLFEQGAAVVDIGGESTRPFSERIDAREELRRIMPVLSRVQTALPEACLSVDTYKSEVAARVLEAGVSMINDVSACRFDPALIDVLVSYQPGYVLMHSLGRPEDMQRDPRYRDVVEDIHAFFEARMNDLIKAGLAEEHIALDPGIGFGKLLEHNLRLLQQIERFYDLGRPVYMGLSNKSMWEKLLGLPSGKRQTATQVATALLAAKGVRVHRVHEVELTRQSLEIVQILRFADNSQ